MINVRKAVTPAVRDVGIVAVTDDSWNGIWTTRHFMLHHLTQFFRVAWLEPMAGWDTQVSKRTVGLVKTTGIEGVEKCQPLWWMPDVYRPQWLRSTIRSLRYKRVASFLRELGCCKIVLYLWRPSYVDVLESRQWFDAVIYHIDDEYSFSEAASPMTPDEHRLICGANAVIVHSPGLADLKGGLNDNMYMVPNGVEYEFYSRRREPPQDLQAIPHPRIGYVGVIKNQLNISLLRQLVELCPTWSFVLIGPLGNLSRKEAEFDAVSKAQNVHLLGYRDIAELPAYQQHFDVCIMPYEVNCYTDCIYPLKLHEYLASGKPIVASPIRTLKDFSHVISLASGADAWIEAIKSYLVKDDLCGTRLSARRAIAAQHDWRVLAGRTANIIASALSDDVRKRVDDARLAMGASKAEVMDCGKLSNETLEVRK